MLCLTIKLHSHSSICFSILFVFQFPPLPFDCIYLLIALRLCVYHIVLFGLMTTRLNKYYCYYYYYYY